MKKLSIKSLLTGLFALVLLGLSSVATASPVDASDIVTRSGMEWAWASPCAPADPSCGTPLVMFDGWALPTAGDFLASFSGLEDLFTAFLGGAKCASDHFNSGHSHCDGANVWPPGAGYTLTVWNAPTADPGWTDNAGNLDFAETFVVRGAHVPEPETLLLLALGLFMLALGRPKAT